MSDVTRILDLVASGDASAAKELLPLVYDELRHLAAAKLAHEKPGRTKADSLLSERRGRVARGGWVTENGGKLTR